MWSKCSNVTNSLNAAFLSPQALTWSFAIEECIVYSYPLDSLTCSYFCQRHPRPSKEMQDEVEQRDFCVSAFNANKAWVCRKSTLLSFHVSKFQHVATLYVRMSINDNMLVLIMDPFQPIRFPQTNWHQWSAATRKGKVAGNQQLEGLHGSPNYLCVVW